MTAASFTNLFAPFTGTRYLLCDRDGGWAQFDTKAELLRDIDSHDPLGVLEVERTGTGTGYSTSDVSDKIAREWVEAHTTDIEWDDDLGRWSVDKFFTDAANEVMGLRPQSSDASHFRHLNSER